MRTRRSRIYNPLDSVAGCHVKVTCGMINLFFMVRDRIENSIPTINGARTRIDQMEKCGFYTHWKTDLQLRPSIYEPG